VELIAPEAPVVRDGSDQLPVLKEPDDPSGASPVKPIKAEVPEVVIK
jgi:hypothetical protein